jgi:hypothetical protein
MFWGFGAGLIGGSVLIGTMFIGPGDIGMAVVGIPFFIGVSFVVWGVIGAVIGRVAQPRGFLLAMLAMTVGAVVLSALLGHIQHVSAQRSFNAGPHTVGL